MAELVARSTISGKSEHPSSYAKRGKDGKTIVILIRPN